MPERQPIASFLEPDFAYGNHGPLEVITIVPNLGKIALDPHESLEYDLSQESPYSTQAVMGKVGELRDNYHVVGDPQSSESQPKQFGVTVLNKHLLEESVPGILVVTTDASNFYDEELNPNNEGNAIEMAYMALANPQPIIVVECPGNGNSTDLTKDEYKQAAKDGRLMEATVDDDGRLMNFTTFETFDAIARALSNEGLDNISHISTNSTSIPYATALATTLTANTLKRAFLYNPINISDHNALGLMVGRSLEILHQKDYEKMSKDPLRINDELKEMAKKVMSDKPKRKIDLARAGAHNPLKLINQSRMFARGNDKGQAAAVHIAAAKLQQPELSQTVVLPRFAAQYKRPEDFREFVQRTYRLLGTHVEVDEIETLQVPLGEYGHSHYPSVRQTFENHAFNR